jgi:hypothetical protein
MDSRMSMASHASGFNPTLREVSLETTEPAEADDDFLAEYHIDTLSDVDIDENETEVLPEEHKEAKDS